MVASGVFEFPVDDSFLDGKNDFNTKKALRLLYFTNGVEKTMTASKGATVKLSQATPEPKLLNNDGLVKWVTPYPGKLSYKTSSGKTEMVEVQSVPKPIELQGEWQVNFPVKNGAPVDTTFDKLTSWTASSNNAIRYFSGTASYQKQFNVPENFLKPDYSLQLDLGSVKELAEVFVNGKNAGILWKAPFRMNIDDFAQEGTNTLEVKITNLWPNRLIGDEQLALDYERKGPNIQQWPDWLLNNTARPTERVTFAAYKHWDKDSELLPSGLLGPVKIVVSKIEKLK
jgi:hypothetical protein